MNPSMILLLFTLVAVFKPIVYCDPSVCSTFNNYTNVVVKIYDNQTKGAQLYEYPQILNGSLRMSNDPQSHCDGIELIGNKIFLTLTKRQLNKDCDKPSGECHIFCGNLKGSLFRTRIAIDQHGPVFRKVHFETTVPESRLLGQNIFTFEENDILRKDCYHTDDRIFTLQNTGKQAFGISYHGNIVLTKQLDYESGDHTFLINVTLNNGNRFAYTTVQINVLDVDDMDPIFDHDDYTLTVTENTNMSAVWMMTEPKISAHDRDTGEGRRNISYSLYDKRDSDKVKINKETGEVKLVKIFDREAQSNYDIKIKVSQTNNELRSATANLHILVVDQNDNRPKFDRPTYTASVAEHSSNGTFVLKVHAIDIDTGNNSKIIYSFVTKQTLFRINKINGEIVVNDPIGLDRENVKEHILKVKATDESSEHFTDETEVHITLSDQNDNSPKFTKVVYLFNTSNANIGQVKATDSDDGNNGKIVYDLEYPSQTISIDKNTGLLKSKGVLLRDYNFRVSACDSPVMKNTRRCSYATVFVHVTSVSITKLSTTASVLENLPVGTIVHKMQISGDSYEIQGNTTPFLIDSRGVILTKSVLDYDNGKHQYNFMVQVLDKQKQIKALINVTVNILDSNDNRSSFSKSSYVFTLPDDVKGGDVIGRIEATDRDSRNNSAIFYMIKRSIDSDSFAINNRGQIKLTKSRNEFKNVYQIYVAASDNGIPRLSSFVQVLITRIIATDNSVRISTPLELEKLQKQKGQLESQISKILKVTAEIKETKAAKIKTHEHITRSYLFLTGNYNNGSSIPVSILQTMVLHHMTEIEALFGNPGRVYISNLDNHGISTAEIALIVIGVVIFVGSIILIALLRRQYQKYQVKQLKFDRLRSNLVRTSSLYESQEIKIPNDDDTSDYAGSLNTQEVELSQSSKNATLERTAFSNPVYESVHGHKLTISPSAVAATNEALDSLHDLSERLEKEDNLQNSPDRIDKENKSDTFDDDFDMKSENIDDETFIKQPMPEIKPSVQISDNDFSGYSNVEMGFTPVDREKEFTNLMRFESDQHIYSQDDDNRGIYDEDETDEVFEVEETTEPVVDYNDKQVRFSSIVLDTEDDIFKPLKDEAISPAHFMYDSDRDDRDGESMTSSFPDLSKLIRHETGETPRADEEIKSPTDFLKADEFRRTPRDNGTFHFGFSNTEQDESTQF